MNMVKYKAKEAIKLAYMQMYWKFMANQPVVNLINNACKMPANFVLGLQQVSPKVNSWKRMCKLVANPKLADKANANLQTISKFIQQVCKGFASCTIF